MAASGSDDTTKRPPWPFSSYSAYACSTRSRTRSCACGVSDRPQQREAATLTIDDVLARRERDVAATAAATLPDGEADQLQAVECAVGEMQLGIREFAGRVAFVVRSDLDDHDVTS